MKITYQFVNGEHSDIDVEDCWAKELSELDRLEYNSNQTETRRHCSLDSMDYEGEIFADDTDIFSEAFAAPASEERLLSAISKLKPKQQELIKAIYFEGKSINEYAANEGVDHSAISHRLAAAKNKLKKLL